MKAASLAPSHNADSKRLVVICLLLISWFSFAAATHFHPISASGTEGHCEFCLVMHGGSDAVPSVSTPAVVPSVIVMAAPVVEECAAKSFLPGFDLYSRPPPLV